MSDAGMPFGDNTLHETESNQHNSTVTWTTQGIARDNRDRLAWNWHILQTWHFTDHVNIYSWAKQIVEFRADILIFVFLARDVW
jgi:hypothetical protein